MKKNLCIVHIGMHKTGSSSIQNYLFKNLNDSSFHYSNLGVANHSGVIYSMFADNPENYHSHIAKNLSKSDVENYNNKNKKMLIDGFDTLDKTMTEIISGEDIGYFNVNEFIRFKHFLDEYFHSIQIIAYIRPPISYIQSAFQELVKHGLKKFDFTHCNPNYNRFQMIEKVFGEEQIVFRPFIIQNLYQHDIVMDFYKTVGIVLPENYKRVKDNEAISLEALSLLYIYQKYNNNFSHGENFFKDRHKLIKILSTIGKSSLKFSNAIIEPILESNKKGLEFLEAKMDEKLQEYSNDNESNVSSEEDLLYLHQDIVEEVKKMIGDEIILSNPNVESPEEIAKLINILKKEKI